MQGLKMQWWPEAARGTCLFSETGRKAEVLNDLRLWRQAKSRQRGSARRTEGHNASNALLKAKGGSGAVGWNSPPGNPRFSREEENRIRIGHHHPPKPPGCRGLKSLHLPARQLLARESRGTPGIRWGGGGASCRRPWRGEKEETPRESKGKEEPGPQLCPSEGRLAGVPRLRGPSGARTAWNPQRLGKEGAEGLRG